LEYKEKVLDSRLEKQLLRQWDSLAAEIEKHKQPTK